MQVDGGQVVVSLSEDLEGQFPVLQSKLLDGSHPHNQDACPHDPSEVGVRVSQIPVFEVGLSPFGPCVPILEPQVCWLSEDEFLLLLLGDLPAPLLLLQPKTHNVVSDHLAHLI
jgi:hypothetical protein